MGYDLIWIDHTLKQASPLVEPVLRTDEIKPSGKFRQLLISGLASNHACRHRRWCDCPSIYPHFQRIGLLPVRFDVGDGEQTRESDHFRGTKRTASIILPGSSGKIRRRILKGSHLSNLLFQATGSQQQTNEF